MVRTGEVKDNLRRSNIRECQTTHLFLHWSQPSQSVALHKSNSKYKKESMLNKKKGTNLLATHNWGNFTSKIFSHFYIM